MEVISAAIDKLKQQIERMANKDNFSLPHPITLSLVLLESPSVKFDF
jgi:hypothetical protein